MSFRIFISHKHGSQFTASVPELPISTISGSTREDVISRVRAAIEELMSNTEILIVEAGADNPWLADGGSFRNHPSWDDFQEGIKLAKEEADRASN